MSDIEEVKEALAELLDLQINGKLSQFYEKYLQVYAALPLIRATALEEAAKVAEERERRERDNDGESVYIEACRDIAYDIRALKEQP